MKRPNASPDPGGPFHTAYPCSSAETEALLKKVRFARGADLDTRMEWVWHPDRAVPTRLAATTWVQSASGREAALVRAALLVRGLQDLRGDGHLWSPLIDEIARAKEVIEHYTERVLSEYGIDDIPANTRISELRSALAEWIAARDEPDAVFALTSFRSDAVLSAVAEFAPLSRLLAAELTDADPKWGAAMATNSRLDRSTAEWLCEWSLRNMVATDAPRTLAFGQTLSDLERAGRSFVRRREIRTLFEALEETPLVPSHFGGRGHRIADALVRLAERLSASDLERLLPHVAHKGDYLVDLVSSPASGAEFARACLDASRSPKLRAALAQADRYRTDPGVREVLHRSSQARVIEGLLETARQSDEVNTLFSRLAEQWPRRAIEWLERDERRRLLQPQSLKPLLESRQRTIRLRAMSLLGDFSSTR